MGGWLALWMASLIITPPLVTLNLLAKLAFLTASLVQSNPALQLSTMSLTCTELAPGGLPTMGLIFASLYEVIVLTLVLGASVWGIRLAFGRSRDFPRFMIAYAVFVTVFALSQFIEIDLLGLMTTRDAAILVRDGALAIVNLAITIPYFLMSRRVRNTFVN